jgi:hypothetical protein
MNRHIAIGSQSLNRKQRRAMKGNRFPSQFDLLISPSVASAFGLTESHRGVLLSESSEVLNGLITEACLSVAGSLAAEPGAIGISGIRSVYCEDLTVLADPEHREIQVFFSAERPEVSPDDPDAEVVFNEQHSTPQEWAARRAQFRAARN